MIWCGGMCGKTLYFIAALGAFCACGFTSLSGVAQTTINKTPAPADHAPGKGPRLPGGASSLSETYGEWTVSCQIVDMQKRCSLWYEQLNNQTGQRLLTVQFSTKTGAEVAGTFTLPFGLALARGVTLKIDGRKAPDALAFSTCQAAGCLVPVSFNDSITQILTRATAMELGAIVMNSLEPVNFSVPLTGLAKALTRTVDLSAY